MPRYELKKDCVFVDAYDLKDLDLNKLNRKPTILPHAHVMNKTTTPPTFTALNDVAGFIGRFIIMGVETDSLLPQIIVSEFVISEEQAKKDIENTRTAMLPYLKEREIVRPYRTENIPADWNENLKDWDGRYQLDFKVNPIGIGFIKGSI